MQSMIEVQDLTKYYGPQLAVSRLDFQVAAGEIVGFLGPNGAGKTTTLKILAGFLAPSAGTARINGYDCVTDSLAVRRSLGYVPENVAIYPDLTVTQFLRFAARAKGVAAKAETGEVDRVVAACGLEGVRGKLVGALSKGFLQRLGLAQALVNQPGIQMAGTAGGELDRGHTLGPDPQTLHPVKVYTPDYSKLWGVGKYATDFGQGTASADMFGDGLDGVMPTSGNLDNNNGVGVAGNAKRRRRKYIASLE